MSAEKSYGFGIIGTGMVAAVHAAAIRATDGAELVAVLGREPGRTARFGERFEVTTYTSLGEFLAHPGLEVVNICAPSGTHALLGIQVAQAGKHLMVEKPVDISLEAADKLIAVCQQVGVKLAVISQRRFEPDVQRLRQALDERRFGRLILGDAFNKWYRTPEYYQSGDWRGSYSVDGGGALMMQAIHYVDLLQWLMGPVRSVQALTRTAAHAIEAEDIAIALLNFENGAVGVLEATTAVYPGLLERLEISGLNGTVVLEGGKVKTWAFKDEATGQTAPVTEGTTGTGGSGATDPAAITNTGHASQIADMVAALREGREPIINGQEARKPLELILAVYQSAREGRVVELPLT
jgi:predicted dehydrogenase